MKILKNKPIKDPIFKPSSHSKLQRACRDLTESLLEDYTTKPRFFACCTKWITNLSLKSFFFLFRKYQIYFEVSTINILQHVKPLDL